MRQPLKVPGRFLVWCERAQRRNSPIGDFAGDALRDEKFPADITSLKELIEYMEELGARDDVLEAARSAWSSYRRSKHTVPDRADALPAAGGAG